MNGLIDELWRERARSPESNEADHPRDGLSSTTRASARDFPGQHENGFRKLAGIIGREAAGEAAEAPPRAAHRPRLARRVEKQCMAAIVLGWPRRPRAVAKAAAAVGKRAKAVMDAGGRVMAPDIVSRDAHQGPRRAEALQGGRVHRAGRSWAPLERARRGAASLWSPRARDPQDVALSSTVPDEALERAHHRAAGSTRPLGLLRTRSAALRRSR